MEANEKQEKQRAVDQLKMQLEEERDVVVRDLRHRFTHEKVHLRLHIY